MNSWKTARRLKTRWTCGDPHVSFREDKLVKKALKEGYRAGIYADYSKDV